MRVFEHSAYQISYPAAWQVYGDANSSVTIAPQNGVSKNAIAYGVLISEYQPEDQNASLDQATHELVTSLRQSNADMKQIGHDEDIRINGNDGKSVELIATSPIRTSTGKALRERDWLVAVREPDGSLLYMVFIAPDPDFGSLRPTYDQMLRTLRLK